MKKVLVFVSLTISISLQAQDIIDLNAITVTSSRIPQKTNETGRNITVLKADSFNQLPVNSIDELLKYIPGIEIQQRGPAGAQSDIVIRGGTFQQVLVLLDGIKINDPVTGHFSSYTPIAPYEIERIEILRGPAAAVYGAEAVGGVINIITKTFNQFNTTKSTKASIAASAGEYGFANVNAGIYKSRPKINLAAGFLSNNANGQMLRGTKGFFYNNTISLSANIDLKNNWQLMLRSSYDNRRFAAQNFYTTFASDTATEKVSSWWNQARLKHSTASRSDEIDIAYKQTSDHYVYNKASVANDNRSTYYVLQYIHSGSLTNSVKFNYGAMADNRIIRSNDRGDHQTWHGAAFSSLHYSRNNWHIQPALRLDADENFGVELLPQLNVSYLLKKITLRANAGRAIRSGDYTERYNNYGKKLVSSGSIGNADLTVERSWSLEAGADIQIGHFKGLATGFFRHQNNLIDWVNTPYAQMPRKDNLSPTGVYALSKNIKTVNTGGIELELTYKLPLGTSHSLYINAGATFLHSTSSDSIPSFYIISHAKQLWQANIIYTIKGLTLSINGIYKKRAPQKVTALTAEISTSYFLVNAKVQYDLSKKIAAFITTNNIGDINYSDLLGSKMPGRWLTAGGKFNF